MLTLEDLYILITLVDDLNIMESLQVQLWLKSIAKLPRSASSNLFLGETHRNTRKLFIFVQYGTHCLTLFIAIQQVV